MHDQTNITTTPCPPYHTSTTVTSLNASFLQPFPNPSRPGRGAQICCTILHVPCSSASAPPCTHASPPQPFPSQLLKQYRRLDAWSSGSLQLSASLRNQLLAQASASCANSGLYCCGIARTCILRDNAVNIRRLCAFSTFFSCSVFPRFLLFSRLYARLISLLSASGFNPRTCGAGRAGLVHVTVIGHVALHACGRCHADGAASASSPPLLSGAAVVLLPGRFGRLDCAQLTGQCTIAPAGHTWKGSSAPPDAAAAHTTERCRRRGAGRSRGADGRTALAGRPRGFVLDSMADSAVVLCPRISMSYAAML